MRMDATSPLTAERVLAEYSEGQLRRIFEVYGEEKLAGRYARKIVEHRAQAPLRRSSELVSVLTDATPAALQHAGHPALGEPPPGLLDLQGAHRSAPSSRSRNCLRSIPPV